MDFYDLLILSAFDACMFLILVHKIKKDLTVKPLYLILFVFVFSFASPVLETVIHNEIVSHILCTTSSIIILYFYLHLNGLKNKVSCMLIYFMIILVILALQLVGIVILHMVMGEVQYAFFMGIMGQTLTLLLVLILSRLVPFSLLEAFIEERNPIFSVVVTTSFALYYGITILWYIDVKNISAFTIEIITIVLLTITINTIILREGFINRMYKEKLSIYDTYLPIIDDMIEELRSKQHDYHNQIQTILAMKKEDLFTDRDIEDYIHDINANNKWKDLLKLDNKIISAFLYSKIIEANNKCIPVQLSIHNFELHSVYSSYQLVEMYGILIDNAMEATDTDGSIALSLYQEDNQNVFEVRNTYPYISTAEINRFFSNGYTTKNNGSRGIGLYKLKKMVDSKKGIIDFYYDTLSGQVIARIHHY